MKISGSAISGELIISAITMETLTQLAHHEICTQVPVGYARCEGYLDRKMREVGLTSWGLRPKSSASKLRYSCTHLAKIRCSLIDSSISVDPKIQRRKPLTYTTRENTCRRIGYLSQGCASSTASGTILGILYVRTTILPHILPCHASRDCKHEFRLVAKTPCPGAVSEHAAGARVG